MLALGGLAYQYIPGSDVEVIKPGKDIIVLGKDLQNKQRSWKLSSFTRGEPFFNSHLWSQNITNVQQEEDY